MASIRTNRAHVRTGSLVTAAATLLATLSVVATAPSAGASPDTTAAGESTTSSTGESTTTPETTTPEAEETSTTAASPTTTASATTTAPATASSAEFTAKLDAECEGDTGQQLLASGLQVVMGDDGSLRIVEIVLRCDIVFEGSVDPELGRPTTNIEALIADPANNVTPNQAQIDLLNEELAIYWRIADAWAQSQGVTATTAAAPESSAPASEAPTSEPQEPATTG
jgi:hypothetical protein